MSRDPDHQEKPPVIILGASTRAAAQSALRAGLAPFCADLFSDRDLALCARVLEVADYPQGLVAAAAAAPRAPWMYTGGLENHPRIVDQVSKSRPLWGNSGDVLRRIRDPWHVAELLIAHELPACRVWPRDGDPPAPDGRWMLKPLRGAAGRGIRIWDDRSAEHASIHEPHYFQERKVGVPYSALFLALPCGAKLLGIARQLVGLRAVHAPPFAWCGTITPVELPAVTAEIITQIGDVLAQRTALRGLFGCDFLIDHGKPWLTEINPRYPASTELVERVLQVPLLDWHRRACESFGDSGAPFAVPNVDGAHAESPHINPSREHRPLVVGKIVLYTDRDLAVPDAERFLLTPSQGHDSGGFDDTLPYMADISAPGTRIARGQPICTLFARAADETDCLEKLVRRAVRFETQIK